MAMPVENDVLCTFDEEVWGGDFSEGKTSNVKLDAIYGRYLSESKTVPSDTMVRLDGQRVKTLIDKVRRHGVVFFPIFMLKHWFAGILTMQPGSRSAVQLTTYDSAPSPVVEQHIRFVFQSVWPTLRLVKGWSPRQERYSDNCGIYMTAIFFRHELGVKAVYRRDLPTRLRRLLAAARQCMPPKECFLERMRMVLTNHPALHKDVFYKEITQLPKPYARRRENDALHMGGASGADERRAAAVVTQRRAVGVCGNAEPLRRPVTWWVERVVNQAQRHASDVYEDMLDPLWAATAMASCGDGVLRPLKHSSLTQEWSQYELQALHPYSVQHILQLLEQRIYVIDSCCACNTTATCTDSRQTFIFTREDGTTMITLELTTNEYYLARGPSLAQLPCHHPVLQYVV